MIKATEIGVIFAYTIPEDVSLKPLVARFGYSPPHGKNNSAVKHLEHAKVVISRPVSTRLYIELYQVEYPNIVHVMDTISCEFDEIGINLGAWAD